MERIKIEDLPVLEELTQEEMANTVGGLALGDPDAGNVQTPPVVVDVQR